MLFFSIFLLVMSLIAVKAILLEASGGLTKSEFNNNQMEGII